MALDYLPSPGWAVIYGETPSATRWSELGDNDDALALGTGIDDLAILNRHMAANSVKAPNIDFSTFNWAADRPGIVNTTAAGGFAFTALNGGLTLVVPVIAGAKYEICINATFVAPTANTQCDLQAQIAGASIIDTITTNANAGVIGVPHFGRKIYTAAATGNITIVCGISAGTSTPVRTDSYTVTARRIS